VAVRPSILGIFPHPDDESYAAAGSLILAARAGARVQIASLTRGERGEWYKRAPSDGRRLADVRTEELAEACRLLHADPPHFLDLPDGQLAEADFPSVVERLVALIRVLRPHVVVGLGADGAYGHPDHIAAYRLIVAAVRAAAGGSRFPQDRLGEPHRVARLLFAAFPPGLFRPQYDRMLATDLGPAVRLLDPRRLGTAREQIDVDVNVRPVAEQKLAVIACHQSQYPGGDAREIFPPGIVDALLARECFSLAPTDVVERGSSILHDLLSGLML
jgi:N-acetyl-1-D-myo-inositol-2-amino-2-deoxy-alpha-D-glucopyranoside deacetylase